MFDAEKIVTEFLPSSTDSEAKRFCFTYLLFKQRHCCSKPHGSLNIGNIH